MDLSDYQSSAAQTSWKDLTDPSVANAAAFGLAHKAGSVANIYKKYYRNEISLKVYNDYLLTELGDVLWYTAAVATAFGLNLDCIASRNLELIQDRVPPPDVSAALTKLPVLDASCPDHERFPRRLVIQFTEAKVHGQLTATLQLVDACPNVFPDGPRTDPTGKQLGFALHTQLGDQLDDNSLRENGYRYHDALHLGFLAVLGWSPIMRSLLHLKRRSQPLLDRTQDGARAKFSEEGLTAQLAQLATKRNNFQTPNAIDTDTFSLVRNATTGLESHDLPAWLWARAILHGFRAMRQLHDRRGGYLVADLDSRSLTYETQYAAP